MVVARACTYGYCMRTCHVVVLVLHHCDDSGNGARLHHPPSLPRLGQSLPQPLGIWQGMPGGILDGVGKHRCDAVLVCVP